MLLTSKEQRGFRRIKVDCDLDFRREGSQRVLRGHCEDLSAGGVLFIARENLDVGARLEISVLPGNRVTPPLNAIIEVVRTEPCPHTGALRVAGVIQRILA